LGEEMTRLVVSGAQVDNLNVVVDGKTIAQHEFDGSIRVTDTGKGSVRAPAIDYRNSVAEVKDFVGGLVGLSSIAEFVNQDFLLDSWSDRWERMNLERVQNMLFVHYKLLDQRPIALQQLYPGCDIQALSDSTAFRVTTFKVLKVGVLRVCDTDFVFDSTAWAHIMRGICDGECRSVKLKDRHPAFDIMHLIREGDILLCFLEQYKAPKSPTQESGSQPDTKVQNVCDKFVPVMEEMAAAATVQGLNMQFVPVFIDLRKKDDKSLQFWHPLWKKHSSSLHIQATVAGGQATVAGGAESLPQLFPCIAHRFRLLEENESRV
jgi:hypothetical protein